MNARTKRNKPQKKENKTTFSDLIKKASKPFIIPLFLIAIFLICLISS